MTLTQQLSDVDLSASRRVGCPGVADVRVVRPYDDLAGLAGQAGQMVDDVRLAVRGLADSEFFGFLPGNMPTPEDFDAPVRAAVKGA